LNWTSYSGLLSLERETTMKTKYEKILVTKEDVVEMSPCVWCDLCPKPRKAGTIMHLFNQDELLGASIQLCHRHLQFISRRAS